MGQTRKKPHPISEVEPNLFPIVTRWFRCQLTAGRGQKFIPKVACLRHGVSRRHEHLYVRLKRWRKSAGF